METKFTKGEWIVTHSGGQVEKKGLPVTSKNAICVLETIPLKITPEVEANAALIAAAPDLLEACIESLSALKSGYVEQRAKATELILNAINKATL